MDNDQALNAEKLSVIADSIKKINDFVDQVYIPDLLAIAPYYADYAGLGEGLGNFLTWGEFPAGDIDDLSKFVVPRAVILNRDLKNLIVPDPRDFEKMKEYISHSWYAYAQGDSTGLYPGKGETVFDYTGPQPPYEHLNVEGKYSWVKAPRWNEMPVEVGPLARVLVMFASGHKETVGLVNAVLETLKAPASALFSTLGRTAARGIETKVFSDLLPGFYKGLVAEIKAGNTDTFDGRKWEPRTWPKRAEGFGFTEAPRGALGHWVVIEGGKIENYQMVVPTTWNGSPRDHKNQPGAYEAALVGTRLAVPSQPLEILRTIHSFDPCLACAIHMVDATGRSLGKVGTGFNVVRRP
jgi:hydrogenase large subunit